MQWQNQSVAVIGKNQAEEVIHFLTSLIPQEVRRAGTHHPLTQSIFWSATSMPTMQILPHPKSFLSNQNGGRATNHDNTKAIGGFKRAAS